MKANTAATNWRNTATGPEAMIGGIWFSVNGSPATGIMDIRFRVEGQEIRIPIETETRHVEANGWVESGDYHAAMFAHPMPEGVKGCPMGRSQDSMWDAITDLAVRTNGESGTLFRASDFIAEHRARMFSV